MRKSLVCFTLITIALLAGLALGNYISAARYEAIIRDLKADLIQKEKQIEELNIFINNLQKWLEDNITAYEDEIINYEAKVSDLQKRISNLEAQLEIEILGVYFSPKGGCENVILNWIKSANKSIHVLIYSFTLDSISKELISAYRRGVDVKVVFEKSQISQSSEYQKLREAGVPVRNDTNPRYMHNKVMIIDGEIVFTGSCNWSTNAEKYNNENLIVIKSREIAKVFEREFEEIWSESVG